MTPPRFERPLRVVQWTTGNIGRRSLHAILARAKGCEPPVDLSTAEPMDPDLLVRKA